jgi:hypothetical protein
MKVDRLCGKSFWLQIQRSRFDSRRYQIFWDVVGLERGPLSLASTTEELLEWKSSGSGLGNREYDRRDPSRWPRGTLYQQKLALTAPTSGGRSFGIVLSRTQATEFSFRGKAKLFLSLINHNTVKTYWRVQIRKAPPFMTSALDRRQ